MLTKEGKKEIMKLAKEDKDNEMHGADGGIE